MKSLHHVFTSILLVLLLGVLTSQCGIQNKSQRTMKNFNTDNYEDAWRIIDSLEREGLPKSALEKVLQLHEKALADNNPSQTIKTLVYREKYNILLEEDGHVKSIYALRKEIDKAGYPTKAILQSITAEAYKRYLEQNYWKLRDRTEVEANFVLEDINTWSIARLISESSTLYRASLEYKEAKNIPIQNFDVITTSLKNNGDRLRPTLYDFLAFRALEHYSNERSYLNLPSDEFVIDNPQAYAYAREFSKHKFETTDSSSQKHQTLLLYQELIDFHLADQDPTALIDVNLMRLNFVHDNYIGENKEELYLKALKDFETKFKTHPESASISYTIAQEYKNSASKYNAKLGEEYKWNLKTALEICEETVEKYPDTRGGELAKNLIIEIKEKELSFNNELFIIPNQASLFKIDYRNLDKIYFKVIAWTEADEEAFNKLDYKELATYLNKKDPIQAFFHEVPNEGDFRNHSAEAKINSLPIGSYMILAADNPNFSSQNNALAYARTQATHLSYFTKINKNEREFFLTDRKSGYPKASVKAEFYHEEYNSRRRRYERKKVGESITDANGRVAIRLSTENSRISVKWIDGKDILDQNNNFYIYPRNYDPRPFNTTILFLDRAIYRPGQTVYYKGLAIRKDENRKPSILKSQNVTIRFLDVNGQEVASQRLRTNEYGTFNGSFVAPSTGLLGRMTLQSDIGNIRKSFRVEEYKRPKFEVTFDNAKGSYRLGDKITLTGKAQAFAGNNIDGAKVKYRVVRNARYPYWRWYWGPMPYSEGREITSGEAITKADGSFEVTFEAIPDKSISPSQKPIFNYEITADVTDITGETRFGKSNLSVGYVALEASINIPSLSQADSLKSLEITTQNLAGEFEAARGKIIIHKLKSPSTPYKDRYWAKPEYQILSKEEFKREFPYFAYKDEDVKENWEKEKTVLNQTFDTKTSKQINLQSLDLQEGIYLLEFETKDKYGTTIEFTREFALYEPYGKKLPSNETSFFASAKTSYEPQEKAQLFYGSDYDNVKVLYEVEHDGKLLEQKWTNLAGLSTFEIPVLEAYRGNFFVHFTFIKENRYYSTNHTIRVPWSNKDLKITYSTFRNKLSPGQEEEWQLKITGSKGEQVAAEFVAAMYDASLDDFAANSWFMSLYENRSMQMNNAVQTFSSVNARLLAFDWNPGRESVRSIYHRKFNWFGLRFDGRSYPVLESSAMTKSRSMDLESNAMAPPPPMSAPMEDDALSEVVVMEETEFLGKEAEGASFNTETTDTPSPKKDFSDVKVRTNLDETVFFMPELRTDAQGNVIIKFTMNEALTKWNFLGMAHTQDLKFATTTESVVTQKDLMVMPNPPRFFREGDEITFTAKVSNLTEKALNGSAKLMLFDAITMKPIDDLLGNKKSEIPFTAQAKQSAPLDWTLTIPKGKVMAVTHRVVAKAGAFSDGEESSLPVVTNRMLVTEAKPLPVRGGETKNFVFQSLADNTSTTLEHHKMTLEFTSNPAWYAVQALPYLMEYPYECTEQIFSRYYANSLATSVANSHPKIKSIFDSWKDTDAMLSNLSKNQELKTALLEETPWVLQAQSEEEQKKNIGLLFDLNRMAKEQDKAIATITDRQLSNGGFPWFPGGRDSWYITQYILEGMGHLDALGVKTLDGNLLYTNQRAVKYIDDRIIEYYEELEKQSKKGYLKLEDDNLSNIAIHYLYVRSFFDFDKSKKAEKVTNYFLGQADKYWLNKGLYQQGMLALALHRSNRKETPERIVKSLKERSLNNEEMGMYWKYNTGYFWYQAPIATHAMMIEVFDEVANDATAVDDLKTWLLKNKQTNHWKTTKATASAVYALLLRGNNWLLADNDVKISFSGKTLDLSKVEKEAGTGYFKTSWEGTEVNTSMSKIQVENTNDVVAWGAMYWQYFEELDKIKHFEETPLTIKKQLFLEDVTKSGKKLNPIAERATLNQGDRVIVRIEIRVDRDMEYIHMKDMRASGFEPENVISSYKWQGGLGYYESTRDLATNFFMDYLPKGTYVFEYPLRVQHKGDFSNGITTIQCMYAPEFTSHSEGIRVSVD